MKMALALQRLPQQGRRDDNRYLDEAIEQMKQTSEILYTEENSLLESKVKSMPYTKEAVREFSSSIQRIRRLFHYLWFGDAWQKLKGQTTKFNREQRFEKRKVTRGTFFNNVVRMPLSSHSF